MRSCLIEHPIQSTANPAQSVLLRTNIQFSWFCACVFCRPLFVWCAVTCFAGGRMQTGFLFCCFLLFGKRRWGRAFPTCWKIVIAIWLCAAHIIIAITYRIHLPCTDGWTDGASGMLSTNDDDDVNSAIVWTTIISNYTIVFNSIKMKIEMKTCAIKMASRVSLTSVKRMQDRINNSVVCLPVQVCSICTGKMACECAGSAGSLHNMIQFDISEEIRRQFIGWTSHLCSDDGRQSTRPLANALAPTSKPQRQTPSNYIIIIRSVNIVISVISFIWSSFMWCDYRSGDCIAFYLILQTNVLIPLVVECFASLLMVLRTSAALRLRCTDSTFGAWCRLTYVVRACNKWMRSGREQSVRKVSNDNRLVSIYMLQSSRDPKLAMPDSISSV